MVVLVASIPIEVLLDTPLAGVSYTVSFHQLFCRRFFFFQQWLPAGHRKTLHSYKMLSKKSAPKRSFPLFSFINPKK